jgi:tetratricopeptide (TPR) repeat protein
VARAAAGDLPDREGRALSGAGSGRDDEAIVPAAIEFATAAAPPRRRDARPWVAAALALCALLALGVIFVLPRLVEPDAAPASPAISAVPAAPEAPAAAAPAPAFDSAARRAAQDALAHLQPLRAELEAAAISTWAAAPFADAVARIEVGDAAYREQRYTEAQAIYADAERQLAALRERIAPTIAEQLASGAAALAAGDAAAAERAFQQVLAMRPDQAAARAGLARAATLPQVRALTAEGQRALDAGELDAAATAFQQALALDGADAAARAGAARVGAQRNARRHQAALDAGFAALQAGDHGAAIQAFERALAVQPESGAARNGLAEARRRATAARIDQLLAGARRAEADEDWSTAARRYGDALALDAGLAAARAGQARAAARERLDAALRATLAAPQRLGDRNVQVAAGALLDEARAQSAPGPRLREQIAALAAALAAASIPIAVELQSDERTAVTLLRVGALGNFASKRLELLPGDYVALGARPGYRDVRVNFSVRPGAPPPAVRIACTETI